MEGGDDWLGSLEEQQDFEEQTANYVDIGTTGGEEQEQVMVKDDLWLGSQQDQDDFADHTLSLLEVSVANPVMGGGVKTTYHVWKTT